MQIAKCMASFCIKTSITHENKWSNVANLLTLSHWAENNNHILSLHIQVEMSYNFDNFTCHATMS